LNIHADAAAQDVVAAANCLQAGRRHKRGAGILAQTRHLCYALLQGICYQSQPESFVAGVRLFPTTWWECRDEYPRRYNLRQTMHPNSTDLAKLWRSGKYPHTPETPDNFKIYPAPAPKKSKRQQKHVDKVRQDELYPAPADDKMAAFADEGVGEKQPGFLVGCSYGMVGAQGWAINNQNMPQVSMRPPDMDLESDHSSRSGGPPCVFAGGQESESERSGDEHILLRFGTTSDSGGGGQQQHGT